LRPLLFLLLLPERGVEIGLTPPCSCAPPAAAVAVAEDEAGAETPPVAALSGSSEMRNTTPRSQSQGLEKTCDIRIVETTRKEKGKTRRKGIRRYIVGDDKEKGTTRRIDDIRPPRHPSIHPSSWACAFLCAWAACS